VAGGSGNGGVGTGVPQFPFTLGAQVAVGANVGVAVQVGVGVGVGVPWARAGGVTRRPKSTNRKQQSVTTQHRPALLRNRQTRVRLAGASSEVASSSVGFMGFPFGCGWDRENGKADAAAGRRKTRFHGVCRFATARRTESSVGRQDYLLCSYPVVLSATTERRCSMSDECIYNARIPQRGRTPRGRLLGRQPFLRVVGEGANANR